MIHSALAGKRLPIYGDGSNVSDWLYVGDYCGAIRRVLGCGRLDETYNIGGCSEMSNLKVVHTVRDLIDRHAPRCIDPVNFCSGVNVESQHL